MDLYRASSCCTSKALRYDSCVTRGSHSFTCHPHTMWMIYRQDSTSVSTSVTVVHFVWMVKRIRFYVTLSLWFHIGNYPSRSFYQMFPVLLFCAHSTSIFGDKWLCEPPSPNARFNTVNTGQQYEVKGCRCRWPWTWPSYWLDDLEKSHELRHFWTFPWATERQAKMARGGQFTVRYLTDTDNCLTTF